MDEGEIETSNEIEALLTPGFENQGGNKFKFGVSEEVKEEDDSSSCNSEKKDDVGSMSSKTETDVKDRTDSIISSAASESAYDSNKSYSSYEFTNSFNEIDFEDVGCQASIKPITRSISV